MKQQYIHLYDNSSGYVQPAVYTMTIDKYEAKGNSDLTHLPLNKMAAVSQTILQTMHFRECKDLHFA